MQKNAIGYAFGYEGVGFRAANPVYMIQAAFPELSSVYGIVASVMFSLAYSTSNIFMGNASKSWNKKVMLGMALIGFSLTSITSGLTNSLAIFAGLRFLFGIFASAINAPIYQLIATTFPIEYRSTANSIENLGYRFGAMFASFMVIIIKNFGWRAMYLGMGTFGVALGIVALLVIKNPEVQST
jgi:ACS family D-galactonate transporter-like MFS transporter